MKDLTKEKLLELGFEKNHVTAEESGDVPYDYYSYGLSDDPYKGECLLSCTDDEVDEKGYYFVTFLSILDTEYETYDQVKKLIDGIKKR